MSIKKFVVCFIVVVCFSVVAFPAFAASPQHQPPSWLTATGAKPVADLELDAVQGEFAFVTLAAIVCKAAAVITLAEIAYFHYKLITSKSFTPNEKRFLNDVCGLKIPQYPRAPKELLWIQGR